MLLYLHSSSLPSNHPLLSVATEYLLSIYEYSEDKSTSGTTQTEFLILYHKYSTKEKSFLRTNPMTQSMNISHPCEVCTLKSQSQVTKIG